MSPSCLHPPGGNNPKMPLTLWWLLISNMFTYKSCLRTNEILFFSKFYSNNDSWNVAINFKLRFNLTEGKSGFFYPTYHILKQSFMLCFTSLKNKWEINSTYHIWCLKENWRVSHQSSLFQHAVDLHWQSLTCIIWIKWKTETIVFAKQGLVHLF